MPIIVAKKLNLWDVMLNFLFGSSKLNSFLVAVGVVYGWCLNLNLLDVRLFTWQFIIRGASGIGMAVLTAASIKVIGIYIDIAIKPQIKNKFSKHGKDKKTEADKTNESNVA